jgi:hypothetical protein
LNSLLKGLLLFDGQKLQLPQLPAVFREDLQCKRKVSVAWLGFARQALRQACPAPHRCLAFIVLTTERCDSFLWFL